MWQVNWSINCEITYKQGVQQLTTGPSFRLSSSTRILCPPRAEFEAARASTANRQGTNLNARSSLPMTVDLERKSTLREDDSVALFGRRGLGRLGIGAVAGKDHLLTVCCHE